MNIILKNFISMLSRYKQACMLNILGLSVAFAAAFIIIIQLKYEWGYDKFYKNADCIYRLEVRNDESNQAIICRPLADAVFQSSPHIKEGALLSPSWDHKLFFTLTKSGAVFSYQEELVKVYPSFVRLFEFEQVEGSLACLDESKKVIIPQSMAKKLFGNESAIGQQLKEVELTVGGVYRDFPKNSTVKNVIYGAFNKQEGFSSWNNWNYYVYLQLDAPESKEDVEKVFKANFNADDIKDGKVNTNIELVLLSDAYTNSPVFFDTPDKGSKQAILFMLGLAVLILVIAIINFTNFATALTPMRIKSINTQKVLGCSTWLLRLSLLVEAILISLIAFLFSLVLVHLASITSLSNLLVAGISLAANSSVIFTLGGLSLLVGLLAGVYPAYYITSFSPALVLKGSFGLTAKGRYLRNILIGFQYSSALGLIIAGMFFFLQNSFMQHAPLGFDKEHILIVKLNTKVMKSKNVYVDQLKSFPEVKTFTFAEQILSSKDSYMGWGRSYEGVNINFTCIPVMPSFLEVMGIPVLEGRNFREDDDQSKNGVLIFNEKAKKTYNLKLGTSIEGSGEIVGFMPDIKFTSFRLEVEPMAFYVWGTENWGTQANYSYLKLKAGANIGEAIKSIRGALANIDPYYPFEIKFYDEILGKLYEKEQRTSTLINLLALLAVLLAMVGVFGLVVFESQYRKKEIAIRKVHGGTVGGLLLRFNRAYLYILLVSFVIAAPLAYFGASSWLTNFAYRIPLYWWVFVLAFVIILLITSITVSLQSWKAANQNPAEIVNRE